jgi:hypothetical protein
MQVGFASVDITPDRLLSLQGQMHLRMARHTRDPLMASAIAFDDGAQRAVIVSCDLCMIPDTFVASVRGQGASRWAIDPARVLIAATHTHVGPCMVAFSATQVVDGAFHDELRGKLVEVVAAALADLEDATLHGNAGWAQHMGWNRRGRHDRGVGMYHGSWRPNFLGSEGPRDGTVPVIVARRGNGSIKAILTGFASHPNSVEGETYYSADFPGELRKALRGALGDVGVVYLTGAAGNTAPSILENNPQNVQPWRGEKGVVRSGQYLAGIVLQQLAAAIDPMPTPVVRLASQTLPIPVRPWNEGFDPVMDVANESARAYYLAQQSQWPQRLATQSPVPVRVNVLRLGEAVICTNPAELFVEFGLDLRRHSPAKLTIISQLTDGYCGYVCTRHAFEGGGYETWPAATSQLAPEGGERIVAATRAMFDQVFAD